MKTIKHYFVLFWFFFRYSVMAGTPEKMVEYLLETRVDNTSNFDGKNNEFIKYNVTKETNISNKLNVT